MTALTFFLLHVDEIFVESSSVYFGQQKPNRRISSVQVSLHISYSWSWRHHSLGVYNMKFAYNSLLEIQRHHVFIPLNTIPPRPIEVARKALDIFYRPKLLEATHISTICGSGYGQKEGYIP
ncbi:hypothetical protein VNO77_25114 [Canavalia gladiata]|uniref:Uncharacterized protein n=1 Tax=Canavalia gladiata TaxID=3824 RepID=A0AAN9LCQ5_CANGL